MTELALVMPLFVAIIYGSLYLTELGVYKLKAQEVARYSTWAFTTRPLSDFGAERIDESAHRQFFVAARDSVVEELDRVYVDLDGANERSQRTASSKTLSAAYTSPTLGDLRNDPGVLVPPGANVQLAEPFSGAWWVLSTVGIGADVGSLISGPFSRLGFNTQGQVTGRANVYTESPVRPGDLASSGAMAGVAKGRGADLSFWGTRFHRRFLDDNQPLSNTLLVDPWRVTQGWSALPGRVDGWERAQFANIVRQVNNRAIETFPGGSLLSMALAVRQALNLFPGGLSQILGVPPNSPEAHLFSRPYTSAEARVQRPDPTSESPAVVGQVDIFAETRSQPESGVGGSRPVRKFETIPLYLDARRANDSGYLEALQRRGPNFMGCPCPEDRGCGCWD